jgi:hypothetical protein
MIGKAGAVWGVLGVILLFGSAVFRLLPYALELRGIPLGWSYELVLVLCLVVIGGGKGYFIFHRKYAPRVVARAAYLAHHPTFMRVLLAPFFCMSFFYATRKRKIISYGVTSGVVGLILLVRRLEQPWHGIVDAGVSFGLGLGMVSIGLFALRAIAGKGANVAIDTP